MAETTPVIIYFGKTGVGKTTILNRILAHPGFAGSAVLTNQTGSVGFDHVSVSRYNTSTRFLNSGCPCCSTRSDFARALREFVARTRRGDIKRVIVEVSGFIDPVPIMAIFGTDPIIAATFHLQSVVAVVDAVSGDSDMTHFPNALRQAAAADRIIIGKTDLATADGLNVHLSHLHAASAIIRCAHGQLDPGSFLDSSLFDALRINYTGCTNVAQTSGRVPAVSVGAAGQSVAIRVMSLQFAQPISWTNFSARLAEFLVTFGTHVVRLYGVMNFVGRSAPTLVSAVGHLPHAPVLLGPWPENSIRESRVVVVTDNVSEAKAEHLRQSLQAAGSESCNANRPSA